VRLAAYLRTNVEDLDYEVRRIVDQTPLRLNTLTGQTTPIAAPGYPPHCLDRVLDGYLHIVWLDRLDAARGDDGRPTAWLHRTAAPFTQANLKSQLCNGSLTGYTHDFPTPVLVSLS
jgi:hypothetical protein